MISDNNGNVYVNDILRKTVWNLKPTRKEIEPNDY